MYLRELKQQFSLHTVEVTNDEKTGKANVYLRGISARVAQAAEDVNQLLNRYNICGISRLTHW